MQQVKSKIPGPSQLIRRGCDRLHCGFEVRFGSNANPTPAGNASAASAYKYAETASTREAGMHDRLIFLLSLLWLVSVGRADPIHFDQIPADVAGYVHLDIDRLLASNLANQVYAAREGHPVNLAAELRNALGTQFSGVTAYYTGGAEQRGALMVRISDPADYTKAENAAMADRDAVVIQINQQKVYYTSAAAALVKSPATQSAEPEAVSQPPQKKKPYSFTLGFDANGPMVDGRPWNPFNGPSYLAFTGNGLLIITSDIRGIAQAIDVLKGTKPSLATQDPLGLKMQPQAASIVVGAGLTATFRRDDPSGASPATAPSTQESTVQNGDLSINLFNPFRARTRLARFEISEEDQNDHIRATLSMTGAESAEQFKNLVTGVKALLFLSNVDTRPYVAALDVQTSGNEVSLHWSYPTAKLVDAAKQWIGSNDGRAHNTTSSATQPAR
jgi:hypothetical protein